MRRRRGTGGTESSKINGLAETKLSEDFLGSSSGYSSEDDYVGRQLSSPLPLSSWRRSSSSGTAGEVMGSLRKAPRQLEGAQCLAGASIDQLASLLGHPGALNPGLGWPSIHWAVTALPPLGLRPAPLFGSFPASSLAWASREEEP